MHIDTEKIRELGPCKERFDNYLKHYPDFSGHLQDFIVLENITYSDKVWVVTRLFTKEQNVKWSLLCVSRVLHIFEDKYPEDKRPRQALEAAENYLNNPSEENRLAANAAYAAANAAYVAAYAAANAAYAANAAAYAAAYAAANAAYAAAYDANTAYAVNAANAAANAAAYAAANAANAANEEKLNILLMLECI